MWLGDLFLSFQRTFDFGYFYCFLEKVRCLRIIFIKGLKSSDALSTRTSKLSYYNNLDLYYRSLFHPTNR